MSTNVKAEKDTPRSHKQNILELLRDIELTPVDVAAEIGCSLNYAQNTLKTLVDEGLCVLTKTNPFTYTSNYDKMSVKVYQSDYDQFDYVIPVSKIEPKRDPIVSLLFGTPKKSYVMHDDDFTGTFKLECGVLEIRGDGTALVSISDCDLDFVVNESDIIWE
jgi:hypothetical protein